VAAILTDGRHINYQLYFLLLTGRYPHGPLMAITNNFIPAAMRGSEKNKITIFNSSQELENFRITSLIL
jgi:hypothetical protein